MATKDPECPICGDVFVDGRGLSGHLQFKHDLSGEEHAEMKEKGMARGEKVREPAPTGENRSVRDRELEIKGMLLECRVNQNKVRVELDEVREKDRSLSVFGLQVLTDAESEKRIDELEGRLSELEEREEELLSKLEELNR